MKPPEQHHPQTYIRLRRRRGERKKKKEKNPITTHREQKKKENKTKMESHWKALLTLLGVVCVCGRWPDQHNEISFQAVSKKERLIARAERERERKYDGTGGQASPVEGVDRIIKVVSSLGQ